MPGRPVTPGGEGSRPYLAEFAELLLAVRHDAGLTVRQVGERTSYSHTHVARATAGKRLPRWELTRAYLRACGVSGEDVEAWQRLWAATKARQPASRQSGTTVLALRTDDDWNDVVSTVRRVVPLLTFLQRAVTLEDLSVALIRLGKRNGLDTLRKVEAQTGIPRATLHGWYAGKRRPAESRLDDLVVGLGATQAEQHEFAQCLQRLSEDGSCNEAHPTTGHQCVLNDAHKGKHQTAKGICWLDDPEADQSIGTGKPEDAVADAIRAVRSFDRQLHRQLRMHGPNHPTTLSTRHNLAFWTGRSGDRAGAVKLFKDLLEAQVRVLGPHHADTLRTLRSLAFWTGRSGDGAGAVKLFKDLLEAQARVLGRHNPDTLHTLSNLALWTGRSGDAAGAVNLFKELSEAQARVLGPHHADTLHTLRNLAFWTGQSGDRAGTTRALEQRLEAFRLELKRLPTNDSQLDSDSMRAVRVRLTAEIKALEDRIKRNEMRID